MPPKSKNDEDIEIPMLGRFTTQLKIGIVGMPNVGKSTFFNVLTKSNVPAQNYPFCTINPNESRVAVPDSRLNFLIDCYKPLESVPAFLNVVDIAGLVAGASKGEGIGNAFLSHVKACDAIFHMIRAFNNIEISHVSGDVDPIRDIEVINSELILKDIEYVESRLENMEKTIIRGNDRTKIYQVECMRKVLEMLNEKTWVRSSRNWDVKEIELLNEHLLITAKPVIYLVNVGARDYIKKKNPWLSKIKQWIDANDPGATMVPFSAEFEEEISKMADEESLKYQEDNKTSSAIPKIIVSGFKTLKLEYFFTTGKDEVKAWTIQKGSKAPQAAGKIHTDFERGFISAEVMKFEDFKELGTEVAVKNAGKYRQEGKKYVVQDGDIIFFKFNVTQQPKKK